MKERTYIRELNNRRSVLEKGIRKAEKFLGTAPKGKVRTGSVGNNPSYYLVTEESGSYGKYMRRSDRELATTLIQKEYAQKY